MEKKQLGGLLTAIKRPNNLKNLGLACAGGILFAWLYDIEQENTLSASRHEAVSALIGHIQDMSSEANSQIMADLTQTGILSAIAYCAVFITGAIILQQDIKGTRLFRNAMIVRLMIAIIGTAAGKLDTLLSVFLAACDCLVMLPLMTLLFEVISYARDVHPFAGKRLSVEGLRHTLKREGHKDVYSLLAGKEDGEMYGVIKSEHGYDVVHIINGQKIVRRFESEDAACRYLEEKLKVKDAAKRMGI